jgi:hypothetical protein
MARDVYVLTDAIDPSKALVKSFTDDGPADPFVISRSDDSKYRIHWLKTNPLNQTGKPCVYLPSRPVSVKVGAGIIDAIPTAGTFTLTGAGGGTSAAIAFDASAATIQAAIRAALVGFGSAVVSLISTGVFEVDRGVTGAAGNITGNSDGLVPSGSTLNITNIQDGTVLLNEKWQVRLLKALPFLCTSGWAGEAAPVVTPTLTQSGSATASKIYSVAWSQNAYGGSVWLAVSTTGVDVQTVGPIPYNATAQEVLEAFERHTGLDNDAGLVSVEQIGPASYNITFGASLLDAPSIATATNSLQMPVLDQADIAVDTAGADAILAGEEQATITFEVEIREESGKPRTVARITDALLLADLITNTPGQTTGGETWVTQDSAVNWLPSVDAYTGSAANMLDAVSTTQKSVPTLWCFNHSTDGLRHYRLKAGTEAENSPVIIRPDDYDGSTNAKVWESVM